MFCPGGRLTPQGRALDRVAAASPVARPEHLLCGPPRSLGAGLRKWTDRPGWSGRPGLRLGGPPMCRRPAGAVSGGALTVLCVAGGFARAGTHTRAPPTGCTQGATSSGISQAARTSTEGRRGPGPDTPSRTPREAPRSFGLAGPAF